MWQNYRHRLVRIHNLLAPLRAGSSTMGPIVCWCCAHFGASFQFSASRCSQAIFLPLRHYMSCWASDSQCLSLASGSWYTVDSLPSTSTSLQGPTQYSLHGHLTECSRRNSCCWIRSQRFGRSDGLLDHHWLASFRSSSPRSRCATCPEYWAAAL